MNEEWGLKNEDSRMQILDIPCYDVKKIEKFIFLALEAELPRVRSQGDLGNE